MNFLPESGGRARRPEWREGFTIIELLVAAVVTALLLVLLLQIIGFTSAQWRRTSESAKAFEGARAGFDALTRALSQATLNTEYDYYNSSRVARLTITDTNALAAFTPDTYGRFSGLHFLSGGSLLPTNHTHALFFQAPMNFDTNQATADFPASGILNAVGFYVQRADDAANRPAFLSSASPAPRTRYRLMQYLQPTDDLDVYRDGSGSSWFLRDLGKASHVLAENIVALVILPKYADGQGQPLDALAPGYEYNSRTHWPPGGALQPVQMHQLPPVARVVMVAIDESSALRNPDLGQEFQSLFLNPTQLQTDIAQMEAILRDASANYRIFQTDVPLRAAKWSK